VALPGAAIAAYSRVVTSRARRLRAPLAIGAAALLSSVYLGVVDPNESGHYPLCPTKALTGLDCPGCGGLRAVHSLMHGDVVGALNHNALVVLVVLPLAVVLWVRWMRREWKGPEPSSDGAPVEVRPASPALLWSLLALAVVFTVVRNIGAVPAFAWLGSAAG
jgi:hypothetical protein